MGNVYQSSLRQIADERLSTDSCLLAEMWQGVDGETIRCQAEFYGGLADNDGYFEWFDPMRFDQHGGEPKTSDPVPSGRVPLEVGWTEIGTTCGHILGEGGLARWPYWSENPTLFYRQATFEI